MVEISSGKIIELAIYLVLIFSFLVGFIAYVMYIFYKNKSKQQEQLLKTIVETQENERLAIAKDMHDQFANIFLAISLELSAMGSLDNSEQINESLGHLNSSLDLAKKEMRYVVRSLAPGNLVNHDWIAELNYLRNFVSRFNIEMIINNNLSEIEISNNSHTNLFRICQELINNAIKYSEATTITIQMRNSNTHLFIEYVDNGIGFDFDNALKNNSLGLKSIDARTQTLKGLSHCITSPGNGVTWKFEFKLKKLIE
jgi:signal transduction histidine kinase